LNKLIAWLVLIFGLAAMLGAGWLAFKLPIPS
jgi:hypothetical protein